MIHWTQGTTPSLPSPTSPPSRFVEEQLALFAMVLNKQVESKNSPSQPSFSSSSSTKTNTNQNMTKTAPRSAAIATATGTATAGGVPCCSVKQFTVQAYETGSWRNPTAIFTAYDGVAQQMRIDLNSGDGVTVKDGIFQLFLNFTSGNAWEYNVITQACSRTYGLDFWIDWCYGTTGNGQTYSNTVEVAGQICDVWNTDDFFWVNDRETCLPVAFARQTGMLTIYYNFTEGAPDSTLFIPPTVCSDEAPPPAPTTGASVTSTTTTNSKKQQHLPHHTPKVHHSSDHAHLQTTATANVLHNRFHEELRHMHMRH